MQIVRPQTLELGWLWNNYNWKVKKLAFIHSKLYNKQIILDYV